MKVGDTMPNLRPYQIEDVNFCLDKNAVGIFNEQRCGKTPTAYQY